MRTAGRARSPVTALDALFVALVRTPDDWVARAALADCYEEAGLETAAACLRWMLARRVRPAPSFSGGAYWYNAKFDYPKGLDRNALLPAPLFAALRAGEATASWPDG